MGPVLWAVTSSTPQPHELLRGEARSPRGAEGWMRGRKPQHWIREKGAASASLGPLLLEPPPSSGGAACGLLRSCCAGGRQGPGSRVPAAPPGGRLCPQVVPLRAVVAVPELQLSTSWVDFGTCFVNQARAREVYLMNLSGCRSYWAVLTGQQEPDRDPVAFRVSPSSGLLEARPVNAPPTSVTLHVSFTARSCDLYESTLVVEGVLGEKPCALRLRGRGSYDERYASPQHRL